MFEIGFITTNVSMSETTNVVLISLRSEDFKYSSNPVWSLFNWFGRFYSLLWIESEFLVEVGFITTNVSMSESASSDLTLVGSSVQFESGLNWSELQFSIN